MNCESELEPLNEEVEVLACAHCKALWFTQGQLKKYGIDHEVILNFAKKHQEDSLDLAFEKNKTKDLCVKCNIPLHIRKYPEAPIVKFAQCAGCAGTYLSARQIVEINENLMTPEQQEAYLVSTMSNIPEYLAAKHAPDSPLLRFAEKWQKIRFWSKDKAGS